MLEIRELLNENLILCAKVYNSAYSIGPWKEEYNILDISRYFINFKKGNYNFIWVLYLDGKVIGIALASRVPTMTRDFCRVEDFCISSDLQGQGYGREFLSLIEKEILSENMDSLLLNTVRGYPAEDFYIKNGFKNIEDSIMFFKDLTKEN